MSWVRPGYEWRAELPINFSKSWNYTIGLGGGSNCCFSQAPRPHLRETLKSRIRKSA
uniref:Putative 2-keto-gluconate dehydrogenase subunit n=1 Tax=Rhizobium fredii TaxID=380 RepID=D1CSY7_RHIFR|nr:putative 2-keto-gluconate dehydrogenase subunit [Sinorhizobium fredii]